MTIKTISRKNKEAKALNNFPYGIFRDILESGDYRDFVKEIRKLSSYFLDYKEGAEFIIESSISNFNPTILKIKNMKKLIDKEARFMFSQSPTINIKTENEEEQEIANKIIEKIIEKSNFESYLIQSAKDCFVGKRIAIMAGFDEEIGSFLKFYNSLQFYYERDFNTNEIKRFVCVENVKKSSQSDKRLFCVFDYEKINGKVFLTSYLINGRMTDKTILIDNQEIDLKQIPVVVIINDGTLLNKEGISEIRDLSDVEAEASRIISADLDAEKKGMNPIRYTVDMASNSTKDLPCGAGAYWDLKHDQNLNEPQPMIGTLAPSMDYSEAVDKTLSRLEDIMYSQQDIPNISSETLAGVITSGKTIEALYYSLIVRCNEKLKSWIPALEQIFKYAIDFVFINLEASKEIYQIDIETKFEYDLDIKANYALPDNKQDEMEQDVNEVNAEIRSRKSYMLKWRDDIETDEEAEKEIMQIAIEKNMLDTLSMNTSVVSELDNRNLESELQNVKQNAEETINGNN